MRNLSPLLSLLFLGWIGAQKVDAPKPLPNAHAHNDYEHPRPLLDALDNGFCNVEADIHLVDGKLLVGHDADHLRRDRTLQALYLDPLKQRVATNAGRVFPHGPVFTLMIDIKTPAAPTYAALRDVLKTYAPMLVVSGDASRGEQQPGAIRIVISGNRDRATMTAESPHYAALDGQLPDLDAQPSPPAALVPWVSAEWKKVFKWTGQGPMPADERQRLQALAARAHAQGRQIRFWGAPDDETTWKTLRDAGVDLINTDDLPGLARFLNERPASR